MEQDLKTNRELQQENEELRARLEEAEETLRAIREGEVDSLIISTPGGEQIYTLEGADRTYRTLIESMQQGAATLLADGTVLYSNQYFARLLMTPLQQLIGASIHSFVHPADESRFKALIEQGRRCCSEGELHFQTTDGALIPVYLAFNCLQLGETNGLGLAVTDLRPVAAAEQLARANEQLKREIAEHKRTEEKLHEANGQLASANERLADADRRKDEFLAMLAHELRNPLAPIRNAVHVLRLTGSREPTAMRQKDIIDRQVTHMARLLEDLLDVSRITRGKVELHKQPLHLTDAIVHAIETSTPLIEARHHTLAVTLPPDDLRLDADLDRLSQIVGNLLVNAAKYTDEGGRIWLEAAREYTGAGGDGQAVVRVRDTGVGIAPELLPKIFDIFTQADRSLDRAQGGLGIGLTMVKRLVEMHRGTVEARSGGTGQGSEFIVRLPALPSVTQTPVRAAKAEERAPEMTPCRILVVDDVIDTSETFAELLGLWGHEVRMVHDGSAALAEARSFRPEVVLLDIGLPGMDGYEVARRLRKEHTDRPMRLVALTGYGQESDRQMTHEAGFDHHLVKPVDLATLRKLLVRDVAQASSLQRS